MDLRDLRLSLRRNWVVAIIAFDLCVILGVLAAFVPASSYAATAVLSVQPQLTDSSDPARLTSFIVPVVVERAESRVLRTELREDLAPDVAALSVGVEVTAQTSVLRVQVTTENALGSQIWANAIAEAIIDDPSISSSVAINVIDPAIVPKSAASPRPLPIMLAATVLGLIAAVFSAVIIGRVRDAFDSAETIRQRLGTNVIGELPRLRSLRRNDRALVEVLEEGTTVLSESFKSLRANLEIRIAAQQPRAIAVDRKSVV